MRLKFSIFYIQNFACKSNFLLYKIFVDIYNKN